MNSFGENKDLVTLTSQVYLVPIDPKYAININIEYCKSLAELMNLLLCPIDRAL